MFALQFVPSNEGPAYQAVVVGTIQAGKTTLEEANKMNFDAPTIPEEHEPEPEPKLKNSRF